MNYIMIKRTFDIFFSISIIICLSPIFFILILLIKLDSPGPVFFKQKRIGLNKKHFQILKFRTMKIETPQNCPTHMLKNPQQYITRLGVFLRKSSLDELPQIINILKGEMSLIGPRPALWNQFDLIEERDKYKANNILPGLTGWAQINGRDELPIEKKAKLDGDYVNHMSLTFDIKIFFQTISSVLRHKGVKEGS